MFHEISRDGACDLQWVSVSQRGRRTMIHCDEKGWPSFMYPEVLRVRMPCLYGIWGIENPEVNIVDQIFLRASAEQPAVISDGCVLTYGTLLERTSVAAAWLKCCLGFQQDGVSRVGLACANGVDYIVLALAILKAGGCLVGGSCIKRASHAAATDVRSSNVP